MARPQVGRPAYWDQALRDLVKCDRVLRRIIPQYPGLCLTTRGDPFVTLARSIVGQQISVASAQATWERLIASIQDFTPMRVARVPIARLRA